MTKSPNFADIFIPMDFLLNSITEKINCEVFGDRKEDFEVKTLLFDSRKLGNSDGTIFFAIKTLSNNGEKYIPELYSRGIRVFVVENLPNDVLFMKRHALSL